MNEYTQRHDDNPAPPRHVRKGLYLLPSMFTAGNMAAGYYAISQAMQGAVNDPWHFDQAAKAIGVAIVLDFFDGGIARLTNTASAFGRELDSLADVIAFGIAPAVLALDLGFSNVAAGHGPRSARARAATRCYRDVRLPAGGRVASGALQHSNQPAALKPRAARAKVFCRHAYPGGSRVSGRSGTSSTRKSAADLVALHRLGRLRLRYLLPDGEHLALLQSEGYQLSPAAEFSLDHCHGRGHCC